MKKRILLLLALAICISSLVGISVSAEETSSPSEIAYCTVPMTATVSIYFAVPADSDNPAAEGTSLKVEAWKGEDGKHTVLSPAGYLEIYGKMHIIFVYDNLAASEMETIVNAKVVGGESVVSISVKQWADAYIAANKDNANYQNHVSLVESMLKYGEAIVALTQKPTDVQAEIVNKNGAEGVLTLISDDGDQRTADFFLTEIAPNYSALKLTVAMITARIATLSLTDDGKAWLIDDGGNYVLNVLGNNYKSKLEKSIFYGDKAADYETMVDFWKKIEESEAIDISSHSHTHADWGASDDLVLNDDGSVKYPAGNVIKEVVASAQILRNLIGSQSHAMIRPGGQESENLQYIKELVLNDPTYIGMRTSNGAPPLLGASGTKLNTPEYFKDAANRVNIKTVLVKGFEAAFNSAGDGFATPDGTSPADCIAAGISAWKNYVDLAMENGGWASIGFHGVYPDTTSSTGGYVVYDSQVKALMDYVQPLVDSGRLWLPTFDEATKYYFEWSSAEVKATAYGHNRIEVTLTDGEEDERFNVPLTVRVAVPDNWESAKLGEETLDVHTTANGYRYVYVNIVPGSEVAVITPDN